MDCLHFNNRHCYADSPGKVDNLYRIKDMRHQCRDCIYAYSSEKGDPKNGIPAGTKFEDIPDTWKCPVCGSSKRRFRSQ